jgi:ferredoxin-NADP reductase
LPEGIEAVALDEALPVLLLVAGGTGILPLLQVARRFLGCPEARADAVAPAASTEAAAAQPRGRRVVRLLLCNRTYNDVLCVPELLQLRSDARTESESSADEAAACSRFTVSHALSAESGGDGPPRPPHWPPEWNVFALRGGGDSGGSGGRIGEEVVRQALAMHRPPSGAVALCCGAVGLMKAAKTILTKLGVGEDAVHCLDA